MLISTYFIAILIGVGLAQRRSGQRSFSLEPQDKEIVEVNEQSEVIKGLHISGWVAGSSEWFMDIVAMVRKTELNALVIDCKDETGYVSWRSDVPLARESNASSESRIRDIQAIIRTCEVYSIYPITRIVVFRDPVMAGFRPDIAVHDIRGGLWRTKKGYPYLDPYSKEVWRYNIELAREAAALGFKEIQFDYVRFPTDGNTKRCVYPHRDLRTQDEVITGFLKLAKEELSTLGVFLSIDVFGQTGMGDGDMGIGQRIEEIANFVDIISPMLYPSHYRRGVYGLKDPEAHPYVIVDRSLKDILNKLAGTKCKVRPWLQNFSLSHRYGKDEVRSQIKACYDNGIKGWMLWNPRCRFTRPALEPAF